MSNVRIAYEIFQKTAPGAQAALLAMGKSTEGSGLDKTIVELAKLRVSQINNCAFCLQIHVNVSRRLSVTQDKLDLVATWHEAGIFSENRHLLREGVCSPGLGRDTDAACRPRRARRSL
jgi:AhpD family alkylhydroperoxidase